MQIASKFGVIHKDGGVDVHGEPEYVRAACEASLKRLDVDCIDLYYAHRIDTRVPIEVTVSTLVKNKYLCWNVKTVYIVILMFDIDDSKFKKMLCLIVNLYDLELKLV